MARPISRLCQRLGRPRRREESVDLNELDSGRRVYFAVRYDNRKGDQGDFGPIFSAIVP
ncbi:hypothetical protein FACS189468_1280 [Spirochaetia bacterium]|nr:hypothetical protein FACS189468_1280 [Spirochaetia bacterium]